MKYLDRKSEKVLNVVIKLHRAKFQYVDLPTINVATLGKYLESGELLTILLQLVENGYIYSDIVAGSDPQITGYFLKREGECYSSNKWRSVLYSSFRWIEILLSGAGGVVLGLYLSKYF